MSGSDNETEIGGQHRQFRSTLWTVVLKAADLSSPDRNRALESLIQAYWKPLYFFVRRKGNDSEASKDIAQGFFTALIEKNYLKYVNRGRGKFRTFLLTALEHFMANEYERARAQKRGGGKHFGSLDFDSAENQVGLLASHEEGPERVFQKEWALRVLAQALEGLRVEYESTGRVKEFDALRPLLTRPGLGGPSYAQVGAQLGRTEDEIRKLIHAARANYRRAILDVIRSYTESEAEAREELQDLLTAFA